MHNILPLEKKIHKPTNYIIFPPTWYLQWEKYCNYSLGIVHATGLYQACMNSYS